MSQIEHDTRLGGDEDAGGTERLTLRAEAGSWPVWVDGKGWAIDPGSLDLPPELLADLEAWADRLTAVDGCFDDGDLELQFDRQGREIWQRVAEALRGRVAIAWKASFSEERAEPLT